jgi:hypothetical protein
LTGQQGLPASALHFLRHVDPGKIQAVLAQVVIRRGDATKVVEIRASYWFLVGLGRCRPLSLDLGLVGQDTFVDGRHVGIDRWFGHRAVETVLRALRRIARPVRRLETDHQRKRLGPVLLYELDGKIG